MTTNQPLWPLIDHTTTPTPGHINTLAAVTQ